jgi:hypothetical protein
MLKNSHNKSSESNPPFLSYTSAISFALGYAADSNKSAWSTTAPIDFSPAYPCAGESPRASRTRKAFYEVIRFMFERKDLLRDFLSVLPAMAPPEHYGAKNKLALKDDTEQFLAVHAHGMLDEWAKDIKDTHKITYAEVRPRLHRKPTTRVKAYIAKHDKNGILKALARHLASSPFNFLIPPSSVNNRKHLHTVYSRQVLLEALFYVSPTREFMQQMTKVDQIPWFFHELLARICAVKGFESFNWWITFPEPVKDEYVPVDSRILNSKAHNAEVEKRLKVVDDAFVKMWGILGGKECLGIPVEVEGKKGEVKTVHRMHPSISELFVSAHKKARKLAIDMADLEVLGLDGAPVVPSIPSLHEDYWDQEDLPLSVASEDALRSHYRAEEMRAQRVEMGLEPATSSQAEQEEVNGGKRKRGEGSEGPSKRSRK